MKVFVDCPIEVAMDRVQLRLFECGITSSREKAAEQVRYNDAINAQLIVDDGAKERADLVVHQDR